MQFSNVMLFLNFSSNESSMPIYRQLTIELDKTSINFEDSFVRNFKNNNLC